MGEQTMAAEPPQADMSEEDRMAAEWAAALAESKPAGAEVASEVAARRIRGAGLVHQLRAQAPTPARATTST
jgi:hypothetical protein